MLSKRMNRLALRPPRQARSRATLERLLAAAVELLSERRFEAAPVSEIVARASSSVGAFYTRFADKEALLHYLDDRLFEVGRAHWDAFLDPAHWRGVPAAQIVERLVHLLVQRRRQHRGLLRALALYARTSPDPRFLARAERLNEHVQGRLTDLLLARRGEIGHPRPEQAISAGLFMVDAAIRESVLFRDVAQVRLSDAQLTREMADAYLAYLRVAGAPAAVPRGRSRS